MFNQGNFKPQSGQGPQATRPPPYLQHPSLSHNFQQGPLLPSPQVPTQVCPQVHQPSRPIYQNGPMALHFAARQVSPGGMPNSAQSYLPPPPPPPILGSAALPHMYTTSQQKPQYSYSSYVAPGPAPPPPGSHNSGMLQAIPPRNLPPVPSQGSLHRAPPYQHPGSLQGLHQIPPPPPPLTSSNFPPAQYISSLEPAVGNSQTSSMAPPIPILLPPPPPPPPPPPSPPLAVSSSPQPVPPCTSPPVSSSAPVSMPLLTGSLFQEGAGVSKVDALGEDGLSSQRTMTSANPPPKPKEEKIIERIEELCQLIAKNGPSYEDFTRQKESKNLEFNFLFGGEPGSEAAVAHDYFLWMKTQRHLTCKVNGMVANRMTKNLAIATDPNASADSDMEMEDDITGSEIDQTVSHPLEDQHEATGSISNTFEAKEQLHMLSRSTRVDADASMIFSDEKVCSGSSRLDEQGLKPVSSLDDETFGRSWFGVQGPVTISAEVAEFPFASFKDDSSTPITGAESLPREDAAVANSLSADKYSGEAIKDSSPFRLLQGYASDDSSQNDKDPCLEDANKERVLELVSGGSDKLHRDTGKVDSVSNSPKTEKGIELLSESGLSSRSPKFSLNSPKKAKNSTPVSVASGLISEHIEMMPENHSSHVHVASPKPIPKEDVPAGLCASVALSSKDEKKNEDKRSGLLFNAQKVDKFGRLVREGASDSDSDDSHHARRRHKRGRSRSRSQSRSRSPLDRRRRRWRRSPRRRRGKRSRSRSWSPKNRRGRSRSPSFKHVGRQDRGQIPECFDFRRGKCYRGASCRFMHHGYERSEGSTHHKSKQQHVQLAPISKNYNSPDDYSELSTKASYHKQGTINQEVQYNHDISVIHATKDDISIHNREDSVNITVVDSENLKEVATEVPKSVVQEQHLDGISSVCGTLQKAMDSDHVVADSFPSKLACEFSILTSHAEASKEVLSSSKNSIEQSQINVIVNADDPAQATDDSSISDSSPNQTSKTSPKKLCVDETLPNVDSMHNSSQLPPFITSGSNVESNSAPPMTQIPGDYNLIPQTATNQSQSACLESFPSYMLPDKSSLFSVNSSASLPLPPPLMPLPLPPQIPALNFGTAPMGATLQFQQSCLPPRSDFGFQMSRPYSTGISHIGDFQHRSYPPVHEPHQSLLHTEDYRLNPLSGSRPSDSNIGVTGLSEEDSINRHPVQGLSASNAFAQSSNYPQPTSLQESPAAKMHSFPDDGVPSGEILKSSQIHPYLQQQQSPYDLHHSVPTVYGVPGNISASSRYPADLQDRNQPLHLTRSSIHFNPYASTFEKPLRSRFSCNVFQSEKDLTYSNKHDCPSSLSHVSVDERGVGSRQGISSPFSASGGGRVLPRPVGDQYDPLFDSIEPSNSHRKSDYIQKWEPPGSFDIAPRLKQSNLPLDVEENNKKDFGSIALATSPDNEEFGETADAEVGDVENGSPSDPDQIKSPGKRKKSKESRSMKLFKVCLADFVKEVLKPSWRQGNMSKEAFKTVVKKTVDKVSEAMKSHQVPKSKAKINQYIDSSQRKLTKLVMGYVDKYAKG